MSQNHLHLSASDELELERLTAQGSLPVSVWRRARGLLLLHAGHSLKSVAQEVKVCDMTVSSWRDRYAEEGLALLYDAPRSGRPPQIDGWQRAQITALACSPAPEGHARWSVRLLAERAVELELGASISAKHLHTLLKKTNCNLT